MKSWLPGKRLSSWTRPPGGVTGQQQQLYEGNQVSAVCSSCIQKSKHSIWRLEFHVGGYEKHSIQWEVSPVFLLAGLFVVPPVARQHSWRRQPTNGRNMNKDEPFWGYTCPARVYVSQRMVGTPENPHTCSGPCFPVSWAAPISVNHHSVPCRHTTSSASPGPAGASRNIYLTHVGESIGALWGGISWTFDLFGWYFFLRWWVAPLSPQGDVFQSLRDSSRKQTNSWFLHPRNWNHGRNQRECLGEPRRGGAHLDTALELQKPQHPWRRPRHLFLMQTSWKQLMETYPPDSYIHP